jgi:lysophospholipase L1-like esterase
MEIGVWGDSITYGANDTEGLGWVGRLRKECYEEVYGFYNRGICGDTTEDILKRFDVEVSSIEPNVILFAIGINDAKFPNGGNENKVHFDVFKRNIKELIGRAKARTEKVIIIGLTEVDETAIEGSSSVFKNEEIKKYDSCLNEIAKEEALTFVSMQGVLNIKSDLDDGLHPNAVGYGKIASVILPHIKSLLVTS